ncbi:MAG: SCO family protein [Balneolaceae bacterium]|nr:SCO family protein [Balneolaceae bacterium]
MMVFRINLNFTGILITAVMFCFATGCDRLSVKESLKETEFNLVDQDGQKISFPEAYSGNVMLVGYVYTHCPDICPIITYNMRDVQRELAEEEGLMLVSVSFDPDRDTPEILYQYAESYRLNQGNWRLLTGEKKEVEALLEKLQIATVKTPTRFAEDNTPIYFIDHTDRVTLIDKKGQIRRHYMGSELSSDEVTEDIRTLLQES